MGVSFIFVAALLGPSGILDSPTSHTHSASKSLAVNWYRCAVEATFGDLPSVDCGAIMVPLDHSDPKGDQIQLVMKRFKATGNSTLGSLFLNSGGPGIPTTNMIDYHANYEKTGKEFYREFSPELRASYDLIGLDMRGEGMSQPIYCDPTIYNRANKMIATDEDSFDQLREKNKAFAESCANLTGPLFTKVGTDQVIQDLDLVRQALGDDKFNYLGYSYGTQVGSQYAARYPDKVNRIVLDGNLDHSMTVPQSFAELATALENMLEYFFKWCNTTTDNVLYGQDQPAIWDGILKHADQGTFVAAECLNSSLCKSHYTAEDFIFGAQGLLELGNVPKPLEDATSNFYVLASASTRPATGTPRFLRRRT